MHIFIAVDNHFTSTYNFNNSNTLEQILLLFHKQPTAILKLVITSLVLLLDRFVWSIFFREKPFCLSTKFKKSQIQWLQGLWRNTQNEDIQQE
jgi:predicted permease